ncbi:MAG: hypothetical protein WA775_12685 [Psychroserpens sp.]|uniref:hypothetical protein n=1 Tax=Psychroserpens sp. TaxID=2020870 RepID=UPI003CA238D4
MILKFKARAVTFSDVSIILLLLSLQALSYINKLFSVKQLSGYVFDLNLDLSTFLYVMSIKLYILFLLIIWFITCRHWWRITILVPLSVELFKLVGFINPNTQVFDEVDFLTSLPITIPILIILIIFSRKVNHFSNSQKLYSKLNNDIDLILKEISNENLDKNIENDFYELRKNKNHIDKSEYLKQLIELREKLY